MKDTVKLIIEIPKTEEEIKKKRYRNRPRNIGELAYCP